jgi:SAM-dependent methyltransferase
MSITPLLHRLASRPRVYDAIQFAGGAPVVAGLMRRWLAEARGITIDIGGGTGRIKTLLPAGASHVCVDVDPHKLAGYVSKFRDGRPLFGDVLRLPLRSDAARAVTFVAVSHHLTDSELAIALDEIARVLAPDGTFYFLDPIFVPRRWLSRWLWRHDRGAYPRTSEQLLHHLRNRFRIVDTFEYSIWHRYLTCRCQRL